MTLKLRFHRDVERTLRALAQRDLKTYQIIKRKLQEFAQTGKGDIKQVLPDLYRLRSGRWRAYFGRKGDEVLFTDLVLRSQAYRHEIIERAMRRLKILMLEE